MITHTIVRVFVSPNEVFFKDYLDRCDLNELREYDSFLIDAPVRMVNVVSVKELKEDLAPVSSDFP